MNLTKSLEKYQQLIDAYSSYLAQNDLDKALEYLDMAISECPVREALPTLAKRRETLILTRLHRQPMYKRIFFSKKV